MIEAKVAFLLAGVVWERAASCLKLVHDERVEWAAGRVNSENVLQRAGAIDGRNGRHAAEAGQWRWAESGKTAENWELAGGRREDGTVGEQGYGVLSVRVKTFVSKKEKGLVFDNGTAQVGAELLAAERVLDGLAGSGQGKCRSGFQGLAISKMVSSVERIVAEEAKRAAVEVVAA